MKPATTIRTLDRLLKKFGPFNRQVYMRERQDVGYYDQLLGKRAGMTTHVDKLLTPQPLYQRVGKQNLRDGKADEKVVINSQSNVSVPDDYLFTISPSSMTLDQLDNPKMTLVLKNKEGDEEELRMLDLDRTSFNDKDVLFRAYFRSMNRPRTQ